MQTGRAFSIARDQRDQRGLRDIFFMNVHQSIPLSLQTVLLLVGRNVFMTFAWDGNLKNLSTALVHRCAAGLGDCAFSVPVAGAS